MTTTTAALSALADESAPAHTLALAASSAGVAGSSTANTSPLANVLQLASVEGFPKVLEPPGGVPCLLRLAPFDDDALIVTPVDVQTVEEQKAYLACITDIIVSCDGLRAVAVGGLDDLADPVLWRLGSLNDTPILEVLRPVMSTRVRIIVRDYALHFVQKDSEPPMRPMRLKATPRSLKREVPGLGWLPNKPAAGVLDVWVDGRVRCRARNCKSLTCAIRDADGRMQKLPGWNGNAQQANGCTRDLPHGAALVIGAIEDPPDTWRLPTAGERGTLLALDWHLCAADTQCVCCSPPCDLDNPPCPEAAAGLQSAWAVRPDETTPEAATSSGGGATSSSGGGHAEGGRRTGGRARKQTAQHEAPDNRVPSRGGQGQKRGRTGAGRWGAAGTSADQFR